jgi:integrase
MKIRLTKRAIELARAEMLASRKRRLIIWDSVVPMFGALCTRKGVTLFVRYLPANRQERHMTLGVLGEPGISVEGARKKAAKVREAVRAGADPVQELRQQRKAVELRKPLSEDIAKWMRESSPGWSEATIATYRKVVVRNVLPRLGDRPTADITRREWRDLFAEVAEETPPLARTLRSVMGRFMKWAIHAERIEFDTLPDRGFVAPPTDARERVVTDSEIKRIWAASEALEPRQRAFTQLVVLTVLRSGAAMRARREWTDGRSIVLPGSTPGLKRKGKRRNTPHRVSLSEWAWGLIEPALLEPGVPRVVPTDTIVALRQATGIVDWEWHDLRRSFRTWSAPAGISREAADVVLGHVIHVGDVDRAYQKHTFEAEAADAFHRWQEHVRTLVTDGAQR